MSVTHRPPDPGPPRDGDTDSLEETSTTADTSVSARADASDPALAQQIDRAQLRLQVQALERSLAEERRRNQAIIDQYERILAARDADSSPATDPTGPDANATNRSADRPLARLRRFLSQVWPTGRLRSV